MLIQNFGHNQTQKTFHHPRCLFASNNDAYQCQYIACNFILYVAPFLLNALCSLLILVSTYLFANIKPCITFSMRIFLTFQAEWVAHNSSCLHLTQAFQISIELMYVFVLPTTLWAREQYFLSLVFQCLESFIYKVFL